VSDFGIAVFQPLKRLAVQFIFFLFVAQLAGCSSGGGPRIGDIPEYHTVRAGETLYSIARSYGLDYRQLAQLNELGDGSMIRVGQRLLLPQSGEVRAAGAAAPEPARAATIVPAPPWLWPTSGRLYLRFGQSPKTASGIRIAGKVGQTIHAAASGEIVYAGSGLASYGQLLIIKHNESWLSAYGFNSVLLVREGDKVAAGQNVAEMGQDLAGVAVLHFEIRRAGQPVDPLIYLPAR
jgi:lipoprotein NlpD